MRRLAFATVASLLVAGAGCIMPDLPDPHANDPPPDAMPAPDARLTCEPRVYPVGDGHHNAGMNCLDCHNGQQQGAPIFTFAGTVFKDSAGTIPKTGATVLVIDSAGTTAKAVTQANGNFYSSAHLQPPYFVAVSECPSDNVPMHENFTDGDCNSCHTGLGAPGHILFSN